MMTGRPKRPLICGILSFLAAIATLLLFCRIINPPAFLKDATGHNSYSIIQTSMNNCGFCAFFLAIIALVRRERFPALPVSALIVVLTIVGLFLGAIVLMTTQHMNGR
jgi:amino acid transporter